MFNAPMFSEQKTGTPGEGGTHFTHRAVAPRRLLIFLVAWLLPPPSQRPRPREGPGRGCQDWPVPGSPTYFVGVTAQVGPAAISTGHCPTEGALPATARVPLWDSGRWRGSPRMMKGLAARSGLSLSRTPPAHPGPATPASRGAVCAELGRDAAVGGAVQDRRPQAPDVRGRFAPRAPDVEEKSGRGFCSELGLERRVLGAQASRAPPPSGGSLAVGAGNPHTHEPGAGGTRHRPHPRPNVL